MEEIKQRLESELNHTMNRIRQMGGAVVLEEFPAAIGDNTPWLMKSTSSARTRTAR